MRGAGGDGQCGGVGQADLEFDRGLCRIDAEIVEGGMAQVVACERQQSDRDRSGGCMAREFARRAVSPAQIQGQDDGDGYGRGGAGEPRRQQPVQLSTLSTTAGPFNPAVPAKIVIETPQNP
jgi:hypothetical protein